LTRLESGNETSLNEPFDFPATIEDAVQAYRTEAERRNIRFTIIVENLPKMVIGDAKKIRTVVANLTANAGKRISFRNILLISLDHHLHGK
jgi:signal transduction histidine kinase